MKKQDRQTPQESSLCVPGEYDMATPKTINSVIPPAQEEPNPDTDLPIVIDLARRMTELELTVRQLQSELDYCKEDIRALERCDLSR